MEIITLKRDATCASCGAPLPAGSRARYYSATKIYCEDHPKGGAPAPMGAPSPRDQDNTREILIHLIDQVQILLSQAKDTLRR